MSAKLFQSLRLWKSVFEKTEHFLQIPDSAKNVRISGFWLQMLFFAQFV